MGHQGPPGQHAGLRTARRQVPRSRGPLTRMPPEPKSSRPGPAPRNSWTRASAMSGYRWACREWPVTAPVPADPFLNLPLRPPRPEALRRMPQAAWRRNRTAARRTRACLAEPGRAIPEGRRTLQDVFHGRPAIPRRYRLLPQIRAASARRPSPWVSYSITRMSGRR